MIVSTLHNRLQTATTTLKKSQCFPGSGDDLRKPEPVCTENLSSGVVVVKSAEDGV
jgi:hypothetical protein